MSASGKEFFAGVFGHGTPVAYDKIRLLGHEEPTSPSSTDNPIRLNIAEKRYGTLLPHSVSLNSARDLAEEAIFHPNMDEVPGIENIRADYNGSRDIQFIDPINPEERPAGLSNQSSRYHFDPIHGNTRGAMFATGINHLGVGHPPGTVIIKTENGNTVPTRTVLHEVSHKLLSNAAFNERGIRGYGAGHGWPQARLMIHLTRNLLGNKHAYALKKLYQQHGVNYGNNRI